MTPQLAAAIERQRQTIRKEWEALHASVANRKGPARVCVASSWDVTPVGLMLDWRRAERRGSLLLWHTVIRKHADSDSLVIPV